jgi:outer membrane protein assembly factor BamB
MSTSFGRRRIAAVVAAWVVVACLSGRVLRAQDTLAPSSSTPSRSGYRGWEETWSLEISRGASAPLVWADSLLFVASLDRNLHVVTPGPEPRVVWEKNFKGGFEAAPLVTADRVYLAEMRGGGRLIALDRQTRQIAWADDAGDLVAPPVIADGRIYAVSSTGEVHSYEPTGTRRWSTDLKTRVVAAPVLLGGALVVAASDGWLFALDAATGDLRGSADAEAGPIWGHPIMRPGPPPTALYATLDGQLLEVGSDLAVLQRRSFPSRFYAGPARGPGEGLYLVGHEGTLWAYDWAAAEVTWQRTLPGTFRARPEVGDGIVAAGDLAGTLYIVDRASGDLLWHAGLDDAITSQPLARGDELYVMTESGTLYFFRPTGP